MTTDVRALAIRFADLWAVDPHQMADEIYSPRVTMENMANPARCITSGAELHVVEDRLAALIPEHRHELIRVVVAGRTACLETTVVAPLSHEYAPVCLWWWIDDAGQVAAEIGWFEWDRRVSDSYLSHGTVPGSHVDGGGGDTADPRWRAEQYARGCGRPTRSGEDWRCSRRSARRAMSVTSSAAASTSSAQIARVR